MNLSESFNLAYKPPLSRTPRVEEEEVQEEKRQEEDEEEEDEEEEEWEPQEELRRVAGNDSSAEESPSPSPSPIKRSRSPRIQVRETEDIDDPVSVREELCQHVLTITSNSNTSRLGSQ